MAKRKASFEEDAETMQKMNEEKSEETKNLSALKQLIFLGRREHEYDIEGILFKMVTLTSGQQRSMMQEIMSLSDEQRVAGMREAILSRSVIAANGVPLENLYEGDDADSLTDAQKRSLIISEMQFSIVEQLFVKYNELTAIEEESEENLKK
mgnify:CR=1 FL=1